MNVGRYAFLIALGLLALPVPFPLPAHEIPADIRTYTFVRPAGSQVQLLVRVPLSAVRDVVYPEIPGGFLDVERLRPQLPNLARQWIADSLIVTEDGTALGPPSISATQLSFAADPSFRSFQSALARVLGSGFNNEARVVWNQLWFDVLLEYPIRSAAASFTLQTGFERLAMRVSSSVRFLPDRALVPEGTERVYSLHFEGGSGDTEPLPLDPRWHQAAGRFVAMGVEHILGGVDHLLFICCLVIPLRRLRPLLIVVTAFTVAHSITLVSAAAGFAPDGLWFPALIETMIALSIVYMALGNMIGATAGTPLNPTGTPVGERWQRRWLVAFAFGLVHGFGFSFALRESLQFAGGQLAASLVAFNVGVELGHVAVLFLLVPLLHVLYRFALPERIGAIILSALIAHTGWHWLLERAETLWEYRGAW